MIFITGGICQGKTEFAKTFNLNIIDNFESLVREWINTSADIDAHIADILATPDLVVICTEIGCGIIPLDKQERQWREAVGRAACKLAAAATQVFKLEAGIPIQIK
ncbi:bifunctional adenosylcobinamide kinase/adenosylcobinamide-phosphate guanylyltransferase [Candidatus Epulonipiscium viviparus]|uniref:bifunctional adenosylcobinamide kinase/adenosylcobinamide-phosphate guanylyltransferase n=1 Tax=Candidatus Epulonipiscium viviparus TaxID=420336 RepID=UPI00016C0C9A|nr:bifunctional adenosylcobinamide kinase/adenosylcobinamide-phosphate guanylyltransferase [Candidatus Epulopiscium viviparus]